MIGRRVVAAIAAVAAPRVHRRTGTRRDLVPVFGGITASGYYLQQPANVVRGLGGGAVLSYLLPALVTRIVADRPNACRRDRMRMRVGVDPHVALASDVAR